MDDIDPDMIEIALFINFIVSLCIVFLFVLFTLPPDDSMMPIYGRRHHYIRGVGRGRDSVLAVPYSRMDPQRSDVDS